MAFQDAVSALISVHEDEVDTLRRYVAVLEQKCQQQATANKKKNDASALLVGPKASERVAMVDLLKEGKTLVAADEHKAETPQQRAEERVDQQPCGEELKLPSVACADTPELKLTNSTEEEAPSSREVFHPIVPELPQLNTPDMPDPAQHSDEDSIVEVNQIEGNVEQDMEPRMTKFTSMISTTEIPQQKWQRLVGSLLDRVTNSTAELLVHWLQSDETLDHAKANQPGVDLWAEREGLRQSGDNKRRAVQSAWQGATKEGLDVSCGVSSDYSFSTDAGVFHQNQWRTLVAHVEKKFVVDPQSITRMRWAIVGLVLMMYDLVYLPMLAFDLDANFFTDTMAWFSQVFWSLDIVFTFFTGIHVNSENVVDLQKIARSYFVSWFFLDMLVVMPLWVVMLWSADEDAANSLQAFRYFRMLRFLRLLRLAKFERMLSEALAHINSPVIMLVLGMIKLMICLVVLSHVNACTWFAVGQASNNGWTQTVKENTLLYKYMASMHWALTQFQGTSEIVPGGSTWERSYAVMCVLLSLLVLSAFISNLTNMMMQLQALHAERNFQTRAVRSFLSSHKISIALSVRVKKYVEWKHTLNNKNLHDEEVFQLLPTQLLMDLQNEIRVPCFAHHDFFKIFVQIYPRLTRRICAQALSPNTPAPEELIFSAMETCLRMYFVVAGKLNYTIIRRQSCHTAMAVGSHVVAAGEYLSEPCLWMHWQNKGDLVVGHFANLFVMNSEDFANLVTSHAPALASCTLYARRYAAGMCRWGWAVTDIVTPCKLMTKK